MATTGLTDVMYAGNIRELEYTITDEDNAGVALNITNFRIKWAISALAADGSFSTTPTLVKDSNVGTQIVKTNPTGGVCLVTLEPADTAALGGRTFYLELEVFDPSDKPVVVATGTLEVRRNIVNP